MIGVGEYTISDDDTMVTKHVKCLYLKPPPSYRCKLRPFGTQSDFFTTSMNSGAKQQSIFAIGDKLGV